MTLLWFRVKKTQTFQTSQSETVTTTETRAEVDIVRVEEPEKLDVEESELDKKCERGSKKPIASTQVTELVVLAAYLVAEKMKCFSNWKSYSLR